MQSRKNCISKIFLQTDIKCLRKCIAWNNAKSNHSKTSPNYPRSHKKFPRACNWVIFTWWASPNNFSSHMYKPFWIKKICPGWQGGSGKVKIGQNVAQNGPCFWLWSFLEAPKWVKVPWNGPQMIPPIAPDWFESISGVLDPFRGL